MGRWEFLDSFVMGKRELLSEGGSFVVQSFVLSRTGER